MPAARSASRRNTYKPSLTALEKTSKEPQNKRKRNDEEFEQLFVTPDSPTTPRPSKKTKDTGASSRNSHEVSGQDTTPAKPQQASVWISALLLETKQGAIGVFFGDGDERNWVELLSEEFETTDDVYAKGIARMVEKATAGGVELPSIIYTDCQSLINKDLSSGQKSAASYQILRLLPDDKKQLEAAYRLLSKLKETSSAQPENSDMMEVETESAAQANGSEQAADQAEIVGSQATKEVKEDQKETEGMQESDKHEDTPPPRPSSSSWLPSFGLEGLLGIFKSPFKK